MLGKEVQGVGSSVELDCFLQHSRIVDESTADPKCHQCLKVIPFGIQLIERMAQ